MSDPANQTSLSNGQAGGIRRRIGPDEQLITLTEATKALPTVNGKRPAICTLWRWCRKGLRGVFLAEYVRVGRETRLRRGFGGQVCTTREALLRFFSEPVEFGVRGPCRRSRGA